MIGKNVLNILLLCIAIFLISCKTPVETNYPYSEQQKMQSAHHWEVLADEVVKQVKQNPRISKVTALAVYPKFYLHNREDIAIWTTKQHLSAADEASRLATIPFKRAYQNYLIAKLVETGYNVVDDAGDAELVMSFDVQLVRQSKPIGGSSKSDSEMTNYEVVITTSVKSENTYLLCHTGTYYVNNPPWDDNYSIQGKIMEVVDR